MFARRSQPQPLQGDSSTWSYSAFNHSRTSEYDVPCLSSGSLSSESSQSDVEAFTPPSSPLRPIISSKIPLSDVERAKRHVLYEAFGFTQISPTEEKGPSFEVIVWPPTPPQIEQAVFPMETAFAAPCSQPRRPKLARTKGRSGQTVPELWRLPSVPEASILEDEAIAHQLQDVRLCLNQHAQVLPSGSEDLDSTLEYAVHPFTPELLATVLMEDMSPLELPSAFFTPLPSSMYTNAQLCLSPILEIPENDEGTCFSNPYFL